MAFLDDTDPESHTPGPKHGPEYRFNLRRRWDWFGLRSPLAATVEMSERCEHLGLLRIWETVKPGEFIETRGAIELLRSIRTPSDPEAMKAKLLAMLEVDVTATVFAMQSLFRQADAAPECESAQVRAMQAVLDATNDDLKGARAVIDELRAKLRWEERSVRECVAKGYRATSITTADDVVAERGDNVYLGTDPERRLILIDLTEALCAEGLKVIGLPDGVPVFSKRDHARAWKRSQRTPSPSPVSSGTAQGDAMPTASVGGTTGGAPALGRDGTALFPEAC